MRYGDFTHEVCFTPDLLIKLLRHAGFTACEARACDPVPWGYSLRSSIRSVGWQAIRAACMAWNRIETGGTAGGIYSRVFLVSGNKSP